MTTLAAPQQLTFEPEAHVYQLDGKRIPSVTQILSHGQDLSRIPRWTAERGTAFHLATEYDDAGDLDESTVDPLVLPHLTAYRKWKAATKPRFAATEMKVHGELDGLLFAGTIDRVIEAPTQFRVDIADLKSGAPRKEHGAQLAAYRIALLQFCDASPEGSISVRSIKGVYCTKDGAYSERAYDGPEHLETFRAKLVRYYEEAM